MQAFIGEAMEAVDGAVTAFRAGMLLVEASHPGVDVLDGQGGEGRLGWGSPFHRRFYP